MLKIERAVQAMDDPKTVGRKTGE